MRLLVRSLPMVLLIAASACERRGAVAPTYEGTEGKVNAHQKPLLKQFGDLSLDDLRYHPVWIQCHIVDYDEAWYDETDEETFRPWTGPVPVGPEEGMLLVRAEFALADGTKFPGFITPQHDGERLSLGTIQPHLFAPSGEVFSFWGGITKSSPEERQHFYTTLEKDVSTVFPMRFSAEMGLTSGQTSGEVPGFCSVKKGDAIEIAK